MRVIIFVILSIAVLLLFGAIAYVLCIAAGGDKQGYKGLRTGAEHKAGKGSTEWV